MLGPGLSCENWRPRGIAVARPQSSSFLPIPVTMAPFSQSFLPSLPAHRVLPALLAPLAKMVLMASQALLDLLVPVDAQEKLAPL